MFFSGTQHIYLPSGQQLHFAIVAANGQVDLNPDVTVTSFGNTFNVGISSQFDSIGLTADANNTLDSSAMLAGSQRATDHSWVYLKTGTQVGINLAWSGDYVNTLHFVRMDSDPGIPGSLRVGGVDYGNTNAFRNAVQANWESFSSTQGHSTATSSTTWTVQGSDGFYAPVLVSGPGDIWMINQSPTLTANVDGQQHVRNFGANTFGFEDMNASAGADFDYNDMVMRLSIL